MIDLIIIFDEWDGWKNSVFDIPERMTEMCDCRNSMVKQFQEFYPEATSVSGQYELLSGRSYSNYEIKLPDKKKPINRLLLHSYCPHCGEPYEQAGE